MAFDSEVDQQLFKDFRLLSNIIVQDSSLNLKVNLDRLEKVIVLNALLNLR